MNKNKLKEHLTTDWNVDIVEITGKDLKELRAMKSTLEGTTKSTEGRRLRKIGRNNKVDVRKRTYVSR